MGVEVPNFGELRAAKATYSAVCENLIPIQQVAVQPGAERQGADAWQGLKAGYADLAKDLDALSAIELKSADYLDEILADLS